MKVMDSWCVGVLYGYNEYFVTLKCIFILIILTAILQTFYFLTYLQLNIDILAFQCYLLLVNNHLLFDAIDLKHYMKSTFSLNCIVQSESSLIVIVFMFLSQILQKPRK